MRSVPHHARRSALGALAAAALAGTPLEAQCPELPDFQHGNFVCSPEGIEGEYTAIAAGDLSGDLSREVAVIKGSDLIVYHGPDSENVAVPVASDALDVCFARSGGGDGGPALLYVSPSGLRRVEFDDSINAYVAETVSQDVSWQTATRIRWTLHGVGPGQDPGAIGFSPVADSFFRSVPDGFGGFTAPTHLFTHDLAVREFVLLDWYGDATREIAVLHDTGIRLYDQAGTLLLARGGGQSGNSIARVRRTGWSDSLAWVTHVSTSSFLVLFNQAFPSPGYQTDVLGPGTYISMASADLDADRDEDLVLASALSSELKLFHLEETAGSGWFASVPTSTIDMSVDQADMATGKLVVANLFNDWTAQEKPVPGFGIVLDGQNGVEGLRVLPNLALRQEGAPSPDFDRVLYWSACASGDFLSRWLVEVGNGWGTIDQQQVEIVIRRSPNVQVVPSAHASTIVDYSGPLADFEFQFNGDETTVSHSEENTVSYFVKVRPRKPGFAWRWSILAMTSGCESFAWLRDLPGAAGESEHVLIAFDDTELPGHDGLCDNEGELDEEGHSPCETGGLLQGGRYIPSATPLSYVPGPGGGIVPLD
jgi:hypothetical protein